MTECLGKSKPFGWKEVWCLLCILSHVEHESFKDVRWSSIWRVWLCSPLVSNSRCKQFPSVPSQAWCVDKQKQQTAHRHLPGQNSRGSLSTKVEREYLSASYLSKLLPPFPPHWFPRVIGWQLPCVTGAGIAYDWNWSKGAFSYS